jgi:hypothetical protein
MILFQPVETGQRVKPDYFMDLTSAISNLEGSKSKGSLPMADSGKIGSELRALCRF